ncbi:hypothetical protein C8F04DRAFT_1070657 [Mycena alexandri]|uniref:Uncharacterized protein n=1 Tax=Mycena alexandri TaxID=1745969 RepID=A0AAD6X990_9AGAR|nr:hypothetical protein C8F04DRAFT_1070657 [Mycena alexandri]
MLVGLDSTSWVFGYRTVLSSGFLWCCLFIVRGLLTRYLPEEFAEVDPVPLDFDTFASFGSRLGQQFASPFIFTPQRCYSCTSMWTVFTTVIILWSTSPRLSTACHPVDPAVINYWL